VPLSKPPSFLTLPLFLQWLQSNERINCKLLSLSQRPTKFSLPPNFLICIILSLFSTLAKLVPYLHVAISRPSSSSLKITNRSFRFASPHILSQLPSSYRQSHTNQPLSHSPHASSCIPSPLLASITVTPSLFHSRLKTSTQLQL